MTMPILRQLVKLANPAKNARIVPACSMYDNPYLERHKKMRQVSADAYKKVSVCASQYTSVLIALGVQMHSTVYTRSCDLSLQTTGLTGLFVNEHPHRSLKVVYGRILRALEQIPANAAYRIYTEEIVKHRLALVEQVLRALKVLKHCRSEHSRNPTRRSWRRRSEWVSWKRSSSRCDKTCCCSASVALGRVRAEGRARHNRQQGLGTARGTGT